MSRYPFSFPVPVRDIDAKGRTFRLEAEAADRAALAEVFRIPAVESLSAELRVRRTASGYSVRGALEAQVVQTCVVTLEPMRQAVSEEIEMDLVPARGEIRDEEDGAGMDVDPDRPERFSGGTIDLGAIVSEHLALGLDPYPRAPGVEFAPHQEGGDEPSPFAALARLRERGG